MFDFHVVISNYILYTMIGQIQQIICHFAKAYPFFVFLFYFTPSLWSASLVWQVDGGIVYTNDCSDDRQTEDNSAAFWPTIIQRVSLITTCPNQASFEVSSTSSILDLLDASQISVSLICMSLSVRCQNMVNAWNVLGFWHPGSKRSISSIKVLAKIGCRVLGTYIAGASNLCKNYGTFLLSLWHLINP